MNEQTKSFIDYELKRIRKHVQSTSRIMNAYRIRSWKLMAAEDARDILEDEPNLAFAISDMRDEHDDSVRVAASMDGIGRTLDAETERAYAREMKKIIRAIERFEGLKPVKLHTN